MDLFYLTADVLPRLSLFVLTSVAMAYFAVRARKTPSTGWLAVALGGFAVHHAAFIGFDTIASPVAGSVLDGLSWSSVIVAVWAFLGVAYGFLGALYTRQARTVLAVTGVLALGSAVFIHLGFGPLGGSVSSTALQFIGTSTVVALGGVVALVLARRARELRADPDPGRQEVARSATRSFFVIQFAGLVIPIVGVFRNMGQISTQLDEQIALVMWAIVILGLITMYVNYDLEPTSVLVKVVAFGLMAVVTALGVASVVAFPTSLPIPGGPPEAMRFLPMEGGGYRIAPGGALGGADGRPISFGTSGQSRIPLGFAFPFAGEAWTEVIVDDDGLLTFGELGPRSLREMSRTGVPWIAPLLVWLDADSTHVSVHRDSAQATVTWRDAPLASRRGTATFQVLLRADGEISFRYGSVPGNLAWVQGLSPSRGERLSRVALAPGVELGSRTAAVINRGADWRDAETERAAPYAWLILIAGFVVLVAFPLYLRSGLSQPLHRLVEGVRRAAQGHLDGDVPVGARDEIGRLTEDFNRMTHSLRLAEASLRDYADTLEGRVAKRTAELAASLEDLKAAQAQLVQQEKLASLGQLTAGIAHEIKNPLNFVNNFAGLSQELVAELATETDPEERQAILEDLKANAAKIESHGRRADAIVRSMMEHARSGGGERQLVDLNALVKEYAGLAHHGMRARHPEATVSLDLQLDDAAGTVELAPQEIGRVLINLLDNAFDAVRQRARETEGDYTPTVTVATQRDEAGVQVRVIDNGMGIAPEVAAKVFEPFFTTKPTGQGTGLGLSMSYDIVTLGHGGTLAVEGLPGEGATFTMTLPTS